jgi:hypothetical protein
MLQGICIDTGQSAVLERGTRYFLFPNGPRNFYVSKFPNQNAHKGCFQANYFQIIEKEEWPLEPEILPVSLNSEKVYKAKLIWRRPGYKMTELKEYYVKPGDTHGTFYHDSSLTKLGGCFPLHWFANFIEVEPEEVEPEIIDFDIDFEESEQILIETEPKLAKYEQLSLFDL